MLNTSIASAIEEIELDKSKLAPPKEILPTPTQKIEVNKSETGDIPAENFQYEVLNNYNYQPETQGQMRLWDGVTKTAKDIYHLQVEDTSKPNYLLREPLTQYFEKGPIESVHEGFYMIMNNSSEREHHHTSDSFNVSLINTVIDGKFRGGKEEFRLLFDTTPTTSRSFFSLFLQDAYIRSNRIPHHSILIGNSRPAVGHEGTTSSFAIPFIARSQIARNFGTIRKFGTRIIGNYSLIDYDIGGFSSTTFWSEFFPGAEVSCWVNLKPLGKTAGRYGKPVIGGGVVSGQHHAKDFFVANAYVGYEYKRAYVKAEYANANGSNGGSGFTTKKREGWCVTLGYKITKKLEFLLRYDEFDPDKMVSNNNKREYTAGLNYYIKGQALRLILNYVFCQNQNADDSHRVVIGTQIGL